MQKALFFLASLVLFAIGSEAKAQGGWDTVKHPNLGLTFKMARDYHALPPSPLEQHIKLIYEEDVDKDKKKQKKLIPRMEIVIIDHSFGAKSAVSGGGEQAAEDESKQPPINSLERYMEQRRRGWALGVGSPGKDRGDYSVSEYEFIGPQTSMRGVAYVYQTSLRTVVFFGRCHRDDLKQQSKIWKGMLKQAKLVEPDFVKSDKVAGKLLTSYRKKGYLDPEFRVATRAALPKGWKAEDTENYILVFSTKDEPLVRLVARELEAMRKEYERRFPPLAPVTVVSRVRICKDQQEYFSYGGPPSSGGYWNWREEELVFFDYENVDGKAGTGKANSRIVLYHEAFHQYIFYSSGSFSPHSWFNEGTGDYFSGSKVSSGKVKKIGVNPWRIATIQAMIERYDFAPWKKIIRWTQNQYYGRVPSGMVGYKSYAQGWSMIYFLREAKVVRKHPIWSQILDKYFETLRTTYNEGMAALVDSGMAPEQLQKAKAKVSADSLTKAVDVAFDGVDFAEIEAAWSKYTLGLKVPR